MNTPGSTEVSRSSSTPASPEGGLGAILDFDIAEAWDPVADFFKLQHWIFDEHPTFGDWFAEGYGDPKVVWPGFTLRLGVVYVIELVNMLAEAHRSPESEWVERGVVRLRSVCAEHAWPNPGFRNGA